jgi:hypothetical protein
VAPADSNHVLVDKLEFKYIIYVFNEFNALTEINKQLQIKNSVLERIIGDKDRMIQLKEEENQMINETMKNIKPKWYDRFWIGFSGAVLAVITIVMLVK